MKYDFPQLYIFGYISFIQSLGRQTQREQATPSRYKRVLGFYHSHQCVLQSVQLIEKIAFRNRRER
jgi:hypothetical protein